MVIKVKSIRNGLYIVLKGERNLSFKCSFLTRNMSLIEGTVWVYNKMTLEGIKFIQIRLYWTGIHPYTPVYPGIPWLNPWVSIILLGFHGDFGRKWGIIWPGAV